MPFTLVAFTESQDSAVLTNIAAVADPHVRVVGDDIYVPTYASNLMGYHFMGANFTQGQVLSPTLRKTLNIDVDHADLVDEPASPPNDALFPTNPTPLEGGEALNTQMAEDAAGASRVTALVWFSSGPLAPVTGPIFSIRATSATTLVANAWTNGALTLTQTLPHGTYSVVGMRANSAGLRAARLVFVGLTERPGCAGVDADSDIQDALFRLGGLGSWGTFANDAPPTVDFFSASADAAETVILDVIKVG